jgi:hypothetical protein
MKLHNVNRREPPIVMKNDKALSSQLISQLSTMTTNVINVLYQCVMLIPVSLIYENDARAECDQCDVLLS